MPPQGCGCHRWNRNPASRSSWWQRAAAKPAPGPWHHSKSPDRRVHAAHAGELGSASGASQTTSKHKRSIQADCLKIPAAFPSFFCVPVGVFRHTGMLVLLLRHHLKRSNVRISHRILCCRHTQPENPGSKHTRKGPARDPLVLSRFCRDPIHFGDTMLRGVKILRKQTPRT